jgi:predicted CoA-substrate-specific enzyme activase
MNGSCAGGTGAFIDQMATLLGLTGDEMDTVASQVEKIYTIASRCGVFAKSDIQPLLNQGARKSDIAASILYAVVNQTIGGLAQGHPIKGKVVYLGGPLTFMRQLRESFDKTIKTKGLCPENSLHYVALGAAYSASSKVDLQQAIASLSRYKGDDSIPAIKPLFENEEEYRQFVRRHALASVPIVQDGQYTDGVYLGIDAGSTTVKTVLIDCQGALLDYSYQNNSGNPVPIIKTRLEQLYREHPDIKILGSAVTGYGEEIVRQAFQIDEGLVETVAHFTAAKHFLPQVEFVIDIGGQDIKCFQIHNGAVDNIFLNEACSSGCGSFLQTFATALGYPIDEFARLGLFAKRPVDLGSRCTVFMNSSVKQAQKEGASMEDISAGLSISVVKNALYKVIRATSTSSLGEHVVVQGGTFLNDAVLRAFEQELGIKVVRPDIAGLMGAYGAALYCRSLPRVGSSIIDSQALTAFTHEVKVSTCRFCTNSCRLTVNLFNTGRRYISGNRCERPVTNKTIDESLDLYAWKLNRLQHMAQVAGPDTSKEAIGIPMGLNLYELLPFWKAFFNTLGYPVVTSKPSNRKLYLLGQATIPSDTACFPAKLLHGHVQSLIDAGVKTIFYPCMTYNVDEGLGDNHFNCPIVAYYPEVLAANMDQLGEVRFIKPHVGLHRRTDFPTKMQEHLAPYFGRIAKAKLEKATDAAYTAYAQYLGEVRNEGARIIAQARSQGKRIIVLAGRPYHADPEVSHGIDKLIAGFGVAVVSEDALFPLVEKFPVHVLNQWTYHARLYVAAKVIAHEPDMHLVQLVSFGCGVDAITTDETREILEAAGSMYTQIKIDEITNLGAVRIRIRSLLSALDQQKKQGVK